ncbi:MAG: histidine--tRNA ligase [Campylobacterales bacterium]
MVKSLRGMNDILPPENRRYERLLAILFETAKAWGLEWIETPILEETALFKRSVGESSDIVGKEMYQFIDKGSNDVCMRPEGTAGVVRAFIEAKLDRAGGVHRYFYSGPMYRYERPQKGRLRQFHQFGVEVFGERSVYEDANLILLAATIFTRLSIPYRLKINSLGCIKCAPGYRQSLCDFLEGVEGQICEDCERRKVTNPLRVLDCKNEACQHLYRHAPKLSEHLCEECVSDLATLEAILTRHHIPFERDPNLVRGLDYYSKTAFEFIADHGLGSQNAIAGGGRYDRLVEMLGGKPTPAVGFAIGLERIVELMGEVEEKREGIWLGALDPEAIETLIDFAQALRPRYKAVVDYTPRSMAKHLKNADRDHALYCGVIGSNEFATGTIWIKNLITKEERTLPITEATKELTW